jgi:hypothetical protein
MCLYWYQHQYFLPLQTTTVPIPIPPARILYGLDGTRRGTRLAICQLRALQRTQQDKFPRRPDFRLGIFTLKYCSCIDPVSCQSRFLLGSVPHNPLGNRLFASAMKRRTILTAVAIEAPCLCMFSLFPFFLRSKLTYNRRCIGSVVSNWDIHSTLY